MQNIGRASFPSNAILKHINYSKPSLLVGNESFNSSFFGLLASGGVSVYAIN